VLLAHSQLDYAQLLGPSDPRTTELIAAAAATAEALSLPAVGKRVVELGGGA